MRTGGSGRYGIIVIFKFTFNEKFFHYFRRNTFTCCGSTCWGGGVKKLKKSSSKLFKVSNNEKSICL